MKTFILSIICSYIAEFKLRFYILLDTNTGLNFLFIIKVLPLVKCHPGQPPPFTTPLSLCLEIHASNNILWCASKHTVTICRCQLLPNRNISTSHHCVLFACWQSVRRLLVPRDTGDGTSRCWWLEVVPVLGREHSTVSLSGKQSLSSVLVCWSVCLSVAVRRHSG